MEIPGQLALKKGDPMAVWDKYGLGSIRLFGGRGFDPRYSSLPRSTRFRLALEEAGGLFALYGCYLTGRADLLPSPHLRQLCKIGPVQAFSAQSLVERELGTRVSSVRALEVSPGAEIYTAACQNRRVVVEVYSSERLSRQEQTWKKFASSIRELEDCVETRIARPRALGQFREWLHLAADIERRRSMLANLQDIPAGCVSVFPRLVPELQSKSCLVYEGASSEPLSLGKQSGDSEGPKSLQLLVETLLEQSLLLSLIDAEGRLENFAVLPGGRMGFRVLPVLAPVPVEWHYELLQYMASTVAGQSPRALHMLSRIASTHDPYAGEQRLMRELSGLQPELKINIVTPESVTSLENYWRALANTQMQPPLFLQLFHRQWTLVGQHNGEFAPATDLISESLWAVLGRILRYRAKEVLSLEKGKEWIANSGLMLLTAARQVGMILEQVRDNDLAMIVDHQEDEPSETGLNRRTLSLIRATLILAVFLLAVFISFSASNGAVQFAAGATAVLSAAVLAVFVARID